MIEEIKQKNLFKFIEKMDFKFTDDMELIQSKNSHLMITKGICEKCGQVIKINGNKKVDLINKYSATISDQFELTMLIINELHGSCAALDRKLGKKNYTKRTFRNLIKKQKKLYDLINCKCYIK